MKSIFKCLWVNIGFFTLVGVVHANPKYCSKPGAYYCALKAADPATAEYCGADVLSAIITGKNISSAEMSSAEYYTSRPDWDGPTEWTYQYDSTRAADSIRYGISAREVYHRSWTNENSRPSRVTHHVSVYLYDCQKCEYPYSWDPVNKRCIKYCPPSRPILNKETGLCESNGPKQCEITEGNPVVVVTGEKVQHELPDYQSIGDFPLVFKRNYRSQRAIDANPIYNYQFLNVDATDLFAEITNSSSGWKKYYQPSGYVSGKSYSGWNQSENPDGSQSYVSPEVGFKQWRHNYQYSLWISKDGTTAKLRNPNGEDFRFSKDGDLFVSSQLNGKNLTPIVKDWVAL